MNLFFIQMSPNHWNIEGLIFTHLYLEIVQEQQGTVDTVAEKYVCFGSLCVYQPLEKPHLQLTQSKGKNDSRFFADD
jgi:DNA-binding ferritin-like protein